MLFKEQLASFMKRLDLKAYMRVLKIQIKNFSCDVLRRLTANWVLLSAISVYSLVFSVFLLSRYDSFQSEYYDLGSYSYSFHAATQDSTRIASLILPTKDSLIGHLSPILILILPLYAIWADPRSLLIIASIVMGASAIPLFLIANQRFGNRKLALLLCIVYLTNPLFHNANRYDFHSINFAPLLILSAIFLFEKHHTLSFIFVSMFANTTHEFMSIVTAAMAVALLANEFMHNNKESEEISYVRERKKKAFAALAVIIIGIAWFFAYMYVQAYFDPSTPGSNWVYFGETQSSNFSEKALYFLQMFSPLLFIPLLEPLLLIPILPYVAIVLVSKHSGYWSIFFQYGAFTAPFLFYASIVALAKLHERSTSRPVSMSKILALLLISNAFFAINFSALSPISGYGLSAATNHDSLLNSMLKLIPVNSTVLTQSQIYPHLTDRSEVALYTNNFSMRGRVINRFPDFLVFDTTKESFYNPPILFGYPQSETAPMFTTVLDLIATGNYGIFSACDGAYVFKKDYDGQFMDLEHVRVYPLILNGSWFAGGGFIARPYGVDIFGGSGYGAFFYETYLGTEHSSLSLSFAIQTVESYGSDSWAGIVIGFKNFDNYVVVNLRYPGGHVSIIKVSEGKGQDSVVGAIPFPSIEYQYFTLRLVNDTLRIYVNSVRIADVNLDPSDLVGHIGFANWQQDTNVRFPLLSEM